MPFLPRTFLETLPPLMANYVATGKVRLIHRDFPLPDAPVSKIAAKYANARAPWAATKWSSTQFFKTQPEWSQNGNVDGAVAKVLSPGEMQKFAPWCETRPSTKARLPMWRMGRSDHLTQTPTHGD